MCTPTAVRIFDMTADDLAEVVAIEAQSQGSPWSEGTFREELDREWARLLVARGLEASGVLGYCNFWLVHDEVHLLNLAVAPHARRMGVARSLMNELLRIARAQQSRYVTLEVRRSNEAAIALYEGLGFVAVGLRPGYYADNREDAMVMTLELEPAGSETHRKHS